MFLDSLAVNPYVATLLTTQSTICSHDNVNIKKGIHCCTILCVVYRPLVDVSMSIAYSLCRYSISPPHFVVFLSSSVLPSPVVSLQFPPLSSTVEVYCAYPPQSLFSNCTAYIGSVRIVSILILPSIHLNMLSLLLRVDTMKPTSAPISYSRTSEKV